MPYCPVHRVRAILDGRTPQNSGELNLRFTLDLIDYIAEKGMSYQTINDIVGALEGCKAEFQRRLVAPYEDRKIQSNGDVYGMVHAEEGV